MWLFIHLYMAVIPDDDLGLIPEEDDQQPPRSLTLPTQPVGLVHAQP
jgi:hypothetical protein